MSIPFATSRACPASRFRLARDQTLALELHGPVRVRVYSGLVWLTLAQGSSDIWLGPGQTFDGYASGLAVFEAVNGAAQIELQQRPGWRARLWRAIRGPGRGAGATSSGLPGALSGEASPGGSSKGETIRITQLLPRGLIRWF